MAVIVTRNLPSELIELAETLAVIDAAEANNGAQKTLMAISDPPIAAMGVILFMWDIMHKKSVLSSPILERELGGTERSLV